jgi:putative ABC transport system permease protein
MSLFRLILRNLAYFRRQNLALFAGTLVAVAVLTGALIIGDSVRFSLKKLAETRLGSVRYSLSTGGRFVRSALASELSAGLNAPASAVLMLQGIAINQENQNRIKRVQVVGTDSSFWNFASKVLHAPGSGEAILSENTAAQLGLKAGDALLWSRPASSRSMHLFPPRTSPLLLSG